MSKKTSSTIDGTASDLSVERVPVKQMWRTARSLKPDAKLIDSYCAGSPYAKAVIGAWRFPPDDKATRIKVLSPEEYEETVRRGQHTFGCQ